MHGIISDIVPTIRYQANQSIVHISPTEIENENYKNINPNKTPAINDISLRILKELSRKAAMLLSYLLNANIRLENIPACFNTA